MNTVISKCNVIQILQSIFENSKISGGLFDSWLYLLILIRVLTQEFWPTRYILRRTSWYVIWQSAFFAFAGGRFNWIDCCRRVEAWIALVWDAALQAASHGPRCHQVQSPGHGFLPAHSPKSQDRSNSAGQRGFWVGQAPSGWRSYSGNNAWLVWCIVIYCLQESIRLVIWHYGITGSPPSFRWEGHICPTQ